MLLSNIQLKPEKVLIQPTTEATSSFSTEQKKYDRKAVGIIKGVSKASSLSEGSRVIYDDRDSIDFTLDGLGLSIIDEYDIVATIKEEK